jgi:anaerobic selenocysteine-containing dehydrogenase
LRSKKKKEHRASSLSERIARCLGPGLITGASDDDPSGIATYSQAGAQFSYSVTWTLLVTYPLMAAIQEISARVGRVTGKGIAANLRSVPDHYRIDPVWRKLRLTVQILTKLNRSALVHGEISYILPCLSRTEIDRQKSGPQAVSMEDSTGCMHGSLGQVEPASSALLSEAAIVAGIAKASVRGKSTVPWDEWVADYDRIRDAIALTYPDIFHDFNGRMWEPGGFHRPLGARHRKWDTPTGKANFIAPKALSSGIDTDPQARDVMQLITLRSNGQFNTTVYNYDDRFRGVYGSRWVVLMHRNDIDRLSLQEGDKITLSTAVDDGVKREVGGFRVIAYDIPEGCIAGYYPECNPLLPLWHYAEKSKVPAAKSIPVRIIGPQDAVADAV